MKRKIVVGYDATDQANDALHLGAVLARGLDASLLVASAIEFGPLNGSGPLAGTGYTEIDHTGYAEAKAEHFDRIFDRARAELGNADFERHPLQDTAAHGLSELAETVEAELVVIGSTHHGPIRRALGGTVAARLLHGAPVAVSVAPPGWRRPERARVGVIGVGYDGSEESRIALARAEELAEAFGAKLRVITIAPYFGVDARLGDVGALRSEVWAERLREGVDLVSGGVETERILKQGREASELALQGARVDLLAVGSRGQGPLRRAFAGSVSSELLRTARCPIVVVPRGSETRARIEADAPAATA